MTSHTEVNKVHSGCREKLFHSKMSITNPRQTFMSPAIPFAGTILGGLQPGEMVVIQGSVPQKADRFQVDFTCGSSVKPRADVAFHFNPRFKKSPCVVCNTLQKESWGREEILHRSPFSVGTTFELIILILKDKFRVAVNGNHLLEYKHRMDLELVDTLCVSGKVSIQAAGIVASSSAASPSASLAVRESQMHEEEASSSASWASQDLQSVGKKSSERSPGDLAVPFQGELVKGLSGRRSITIRGETKPNADSFTVNLVISGSSGIALHLNPRLKKRVFIRNSFLSECWGPEEKNLESFPFSAGQYFEMIVLCEAQQFKVAVNGLHQFTYKHRVQDLSLITALEIHGDVVLHEVKTL